MKKLQLGGFFMIHTKKLTIVSILAAISLLLMRISIPIIPIVPYLRLDFSDIPILVGFFIFGISGGVQIAVVRSVLYFVLNGISIGSLIGVTSNLLATFSISLPLYYILKNQRGFVRYIIAILIATLSLTVVLSVANWSFITPLYIQLMGLKLSLPLNEVVIYGIVPFNLIKGFCVSFVFILILIHLGAWLKKKGSEF
ncbi:membrane protein [Ligilactobacillus hayakitensis DSM 18933 = JCM 14209]|uniref:Riboflavin transporter n=2 Tax=Ligilactobacillus TaxID=2767887 RepID=A0A0R1WVC9_9LACO|nr:membrane protein [Ligilactobacillus hayakitensis DSM 18933 = JCM 14209]